MPRNLDIYLPISSVFLRQVLGTRYAKTCLTRLIGLKIIECDGNYEKYVKCLGYRFNKNYRVKFCGKPVKDKKLIIRAQKAIKEFRDEQLTPDEGRIIGYVNENLSNIKINDPKWYDKIKELDPAGCRLGFYALEYREHNLSRIEDGEIWSKSDRQKRLYSNYTAMSRDTRQFLSWKSGEPIYQCDFKAMQPALLATLYPYGSKEKLEFLKIINSGFYEWINDKLNIVDFSDKVQKKMFKEMVFTDFIFTTNACSGRTDIGGLFQDWFPELYAIITKYKKEDHGQLPRDRPTARQTHRATAGWPRRRRRRAGPPG